MKDTHKEKVYQKVYREKKKIMEKLKELKKYIVVGGVKQNMYREKKKIMKKLKKLKLMIINMMKWFIHCKL